MDTAVVTAVALLLVGLTTLTHYQGLLYAGALFALRVAGFGGLAGAPLSLANCIYFSAETYTSPGSATSRRWARFG